MIGIPIKDRFGKQTIEGHHRYCSFDLNAIINNGDLFTGFELVEFYSPFHVSQVLLVSAVLVLGRWGINLTVRIEPTFRAGDLVRVRLFQQKSVQPCQLLAAWILHSRRHSSPFLALGVITSPRIRVGLTRTALTYVAVYLMVYGLPLATARNGWTATATGLAILPVAAVSAVAVVLARRQAPRSASDWRGCTRVRQF